MKQRKVVLTGLGIIAPGVTGKTEYQDVLKSGECFFKEIPSFHKLDFPCKIGAQIDDFDAKDYVSSNGISHLDRFGYFAVAATRLAIEDSGLSISCNEKIGVSLGVSAGGVCSAENEYSKVLSKGKCNPNAIYALFPGSCSGAVFSELGIKGPGMTISTACSSSLDAIGYGLNMIWNGETDVMLMGGADSCFSPFVYYTLSILGIMSKWDGDPKQACRPFERNRTGFVMSEGGAVILAEEEEHALERGANIYGEIAGYAASLDAYHITNREPEGKQAGRACLEAVKQAGIKLEDIDHISAHGTATIINDIQETKIIKTVFKEHAYKLKVSSIKSFLGHALGAAGSMQVVAAALSIKNGFVPPTINYMNPDPQCDLDYVPNKYCEMKINTALVNSAGFGGINSCVILKKYENNLN